MAAVVTALIEHKGHAELVKACLEFSGHSIVIAESFPKAQKLLTLNACDLIISDVHLENGGNVFDFLKWVKREPQLKRIPFILLSLRPTAMAKYLHDAVQLTARELGAARYICMPEYDIALLSHQLSEFLSSPDPTKSLPK